MILRQTIHLSDIAHPLELSQPDFISLCDHLLHSAELEANKNGYELEDSAAYIRCCELLTAGDCGQELSCADKLNILAVTLELYYGRFWETVE